MTVKLLGIDGENREPAKQKALDHRAVRDFDGDTDGSWRSGQRTKPGGDLRDTGRCIGEGAFVTLALDERTGGVGIFGPIDADENRDGTVQENTSERSPGPTMPTRQPYTGARGANILRVVTAWPSRRGAGPTQAVVCRDEGGTPGEMDQASLTLRPQPTCGSPGNV